MHATVNTYRDEIIVDQNGCQSCNYVSMWNFGLDEDFQSHKLRAS